VSTQKKNVDLFQRINEGYLRQIGPDGRYNRDRIFQSLGIAPGRDGDYGQNFGLDDRQRKQVQAAIEKELGFQFPGGIEIDPAGNMNENEGVGKQLKKWGPVAGQVALGIATGGMSLPAQLATLDTHMLAEALRKKVEGPRAVASSPPGFR
jgi:hypothetical protein